MGKKLVYPNYNHSIVSLMNSIRDYFNLKTYHPSLKEVDDILNQKQYKNVYVLLFDGLGSKLLEKHLNENSFLRTHKIDNLSSTFPATTSAATNSVRTGKTPLENGWIGWHQYLKEIDDDIIMFKGKQYYGDKQYDSLLGYKIIPIKSIAEELAEKGKLGKEIFSANIENSKTRNLHLFFKELLKERTKTDKKFIYGYWDKPDKLVHLYGTNSSIVKKEIRKIDSFLKTFSKKLTEDDIAFVIADHGLVDVEYDSLIDHQDLLDTLLRLPVFETRNSSFFIKKGQEKNFERLFNKYYGDNFLLMKTEDVLKQNLFGTGTPHKKITELLGQYQSISVSNRALTYKVDENSPTVAAHSGLLEEEMIVPLIMIKK